MRNLLSANFLRLRKSWLFWGTLVFMAGYALWQIRFWVIFGGITVDPIIFDYAGVIGTAAAVWSSLFLGTDYSNGTMRNKLVAGHTRLAVYFAALITNTTVALLQCAAYLAVAFGLGTLFIGLPTMEASRFLSLLAGTLVMTVAFCAIFTAVGMLCAQKTAAAVLCIAGSLVLFGYMSSVDSYLSIPEYSTSVNIFGDQIEVAYTLNDGYVSGTRRAVFQFLDDVVPSGQAVQYMRNREQEEIDPYIAEVLSPEQMETYMQYQRQKADPLPLAAYSLAVAALFTALGAALFQKKDLK